jgi:hypothetical protein
MPRIGRGPGDSLTRVGIYACLLLGVAACARQPASDPLQSWNDGPSKKAILDFVGRVTGRGADIVPLDQRIAVFDNDAT